MKKYFLLSLCCIFVAHSCLNPPRNKQKDYPQSKNDSVLIEKSIKEPTFMGISFAMDSSDIIKSLDSLCSIDNIWDYYKTGFGEQRIYAQIINMKDRFGWSRGKTEEYFLENYGIGLYIDNYSEKMWREIASCTSSDLIQDSFGFKSTYATNIPLIEDDSTYVKVYAIFGLTFYRNKLREITVCIEGESEYSTSELDFKQTWDNIINTYSLKYGKPQINNTSLAEWTYGAINIKLKYDGIKKKFLDNIYRAEKALYYPYYIITYTNTLLENEISKEYKQRYEEWEKENTIKYKNEQKRLKSEFEKFNI